MLQLTHILSSVQYNEMTEGRPGLPSSEVYPQGGLAIDLSNFAYSDTAVCCSIVLRYVEETVPAG